MVNTLRADVDEANAALQHEMKEAARLRVAGDRTVYDITDRLKSTLSARFLSWFKEGQFAEALQALGQDVKVPEPTKVQFPTKT
jgi:hypothetical protein